MPTDLFTAVDARAMLVAATANIACALVGVLLVVRRQSLMGDAISHAVLPGLVVAFLVSGSFSTVPMLAGAVAAGVVTTFLTEALRRRGGVAADAALGVVFTSLFALGVVLVKRYLKGVHFDVACVYEGSLLHAALEMTSIGPFEAPRALLSAGFVLVVVLCVYAAFWKELRLCAFDSALADTMGFSPTLMHYAVMGLVAMTAAVAFEAVGAILVVAMMITPAAAAHLLTDRLAPMTIVAGALAGCWSVLGYMVAVWLDVSPAGSMATLAGLGYAVAALFSPKYGVLAKLAANARLSLRIRRDDLLALLYRRDERSPGATLAIEDALRSVGGDWWARLSLAVLQHRSQVVTADNTIRLTDSGRDAAARLIRSHRLWESYLVKEVGIADDHVHEAAHVVEHYVDRDLGSQLEDALGGLEKDPHGREIPIESKD